MSDYIIRPIYNDKKEEIIDLIIHIQQQEFNIPVTLNDQPDLLDIEKITMPEAVTFGELLTAMNW